MLIRTVDSHTEGEPTRVILEGLPEVPGENISQQMTYFRENLDHIRAALIHEPRGHANMVGAIVLPPTRGEADVGVFYIDRDRCFGMCGHASLGVGVTLVKTGRIKLIEPETRVVLDTPAGLVTTRVYVKGGRVIGSTLSNVASFLVAKDVSVSLPSGRVPVDVAFGGGFFALARAEDLGLVITPDSIPELVRYAGLIGQYIRERTRVTHPEDDGLGYDGLVYFHGQSEGADADAKSLAVGPGGNFDRSPCGTGTSARLAALYARREMKLGDSLRVESVIGTRFTARIAGECRVARSRAIIPEISASVFLTGYHEFLIDPDDPLKNGFSL